MAYRLLLVLALVARGEIRGGARRDRYNVRLEESVGKSRRQRLEFPHGSPGLGGWESMIIYPLTIWLIGYGNYLMTASD